MNITLKDEDCSIFQIVVGDVFPLLHSTVALIKTRETLILIDSGYFTDSNLLLKNLKRLEVSPSDIDHLILTHFHLDHCGNLYFFKEVQLYMGVEDYILCEEIYKHLNNEHWLTDIILENYNCQNEHKIRALVNLLKNNSSIFMFIMNKKKIKLIDQDMVRLDNRISIKKTPGHTDGHISVFCNLEDIGTVCIAGDALPVNIVKTNDKGFMHQDERLFFQTKNQLITDSDIIIPGHDRLFNL